MVVGEQIGDEGNTAATCGGRCAGFSGVSGGEGERLWRMSEGRNFLSRRRSGGVNGGRVVVGDGIRGVVGDPGGGKSLLRAYLMRFLTLEGRADSLCFRRRCSRNRVRHATSRRPRAELSAMATLVPVASSVSGVVVAVAEMLGESEEPRLVSAAAGALLLALPTVGAPLCVASTAVEVCAAAPPAAADDVCAGSCRSVHSATEPSTMFASVIHV